MVGQSAKKSGKPSQGLGPPQIFGLIGILMAQNFEGLAELHVWSHDGHCENIEEKLQAEQIDP